MNILCLIAKVAVCVTFFGKITAAEGNTFFIIEYDFKYNSGLIRWWKYMCKYTYSFKFVRLVTIALKQAVQMDVWCKMMVDPNFTLDALWLTTLPWIWYGMQITVPISVMRIRAVKDFHLARKTMYQRNEDAFLLRIELIVHQPGDSSNFQKILLYL